MKRQANPRLSSAGMCALARYEQTLRVQEDLAPTSLRNYLSDVRHFMAWYEAREAERTVEDQQRSDFDVQAITTPRRMMLERGAHSNWAKNAWALENGRESGYD